MVTSRGILLLICGAAAGRAEAGAGAGRGSSTLRGVVVDAVTGGPLAGAMVQLCAAGYEAVGDLVNASGACAVKYDRVRTYTRSDGRFELSLAKGWGDLVVITDDDSHTREVVGERELRQGRGPVRVAMRPSASLSVQLRLPNGERWKGEVDCGWFYETRRGMRVRHWAPGSGCGGRDLEPGAATAFVVERQLPFRYATAPVQLRSGESSVISLVLDRRLPYLHGRIVDRKRRPLTGIVVAMDHAAPSVFDRVLLAIGRARIIPDILGEFALVTETPGPARVDVWTWRFLPGKTWTPVKRPLIARQGVATLDERSPATFVMPDVPVVSCTLRDRQRRPLAIGRYRVGAGLWPRGMVTSADPLHFGHFLDDPPQAMQLTFPWIAGTSMNVKVRRASSTGRPLYSGGLRLESPRSPCEIQEQGRGVD